VNVDLCVGIRHNVQLLRSWYSQSWLSITNIRHLRCRKLQISEIGQFVYTEQLIVSWIICAFSSLLRFQWDCCVNSVECSTPTEL
jgi:hypothetical protein